MFDDPAERFFVRADAWGGANFCLWADVPAAPPFRAEPGLRRALDGGATWPPAEVNGPWDAILADALGRPFAPDAPMVRPLRATDRPRIGLVLHHALADARTAAWVLADWLAGRDSGGPWRSLHAAMPPAWRCADVAAGLEREWRRDAIRGGWPARLAGHRPDQPAGAVAWAARALPLASVRARAAELRLTVNAALAGALLHALDQAAEGPGPLLLATAMDLRARLGLGDARGMLVALVPGAVGRTPDAGAQDFARRYADGLARQVARGDPLACWHWLDTATSAAGGPPTVVLSNLGRVDLPGAAAAGLLVAPLPAQPLVATAVTCADRLTLTVTWRSARLAGGAAETVLAGWAAALD